MTLHTMDITYRNQEHSASNFTLNSILDIIVEGVWDWNSHTGHVDRSPGWYRMLGYDFEVFSNTVFTWEKVIHPDDYDRVMQHFEDYINKKSTNYCIEYRCRKCDGSYLWIVDNGKVVEYNEDGTVGRMIGAHHNIHEQKVAQIELIKQNQLLQDGNISLEKVIHRKTNELEKKNGELELKMHEVETLSNKDLLTEVANRKKFEEVLQKEILRSRRYKHPLSFVLFDIDNFKYINDTFGHKVGDSVLRSLSKLITANIREVDFFGRWGGDEFVLIFPNTTIEKALLITEKLRRIISEYEVKPNLFTTCSFGLVERNKSYGVSELFQQADKALYSAKHQGRNMVVSI